MKKVLEALSEMQTKMPIQTVFLILVIAFIALLFGFLSAKNDAKAGAGFAKNLRKDLYYKVQDFSFSNIDKFSTSSLVTRLTTDVTNIQHAFQGALRAAIRAPFMLIFSLIAAFSINRRIALIFLALIPIVSLILFLISRRAHPLFKQTFKKYDDLNNIVEENTSGMRVVKGFVLEDEEIEKFENKSREIYELFSKAERTLAFNHPSIQLAMYTATLFISYLGARIIVNTNMTELTTGQLSRLVTYAIQILMSIMFVTIMIVMATMSIASMQRVAEVLDEEPSIKNPENPVKEVKDG